MSEYLKHKGRLEELKQVRISQALQAESIRDALRELLDPVDDVEHLQGETIVNQALNFSNAQMELAETDEKIAKIKKILGRG